MTERVATARPGAWLKPGTLPFGWAEATIGDLIGSDGIFRDGDWVETKDQDPEGDVRLTQLADIGVGFFRDRSSRFLTSEAAACLGCTFLEPGDVLIARMPDPLGRACLFPGDSRRCVTAVDVCIVRPGSTGVDPRWLMWWINTPEFRGDISALQAGTTRKRISRKNLATIEFPLPPLNEQRRIVAAIEEHLSRLDAADASLTAASRRLDALLGLTFASALDGGEKVAIGDLGEVVTGSTPPTSHPEFWGDDVPFATPSDLAPGRAIARTERHITPLGAERARLLPARSVLVTCIGATIGKTSLALMPCATNQQINAVVADETRVLPEYLLASLSSTPGQRLIIDASASTTMPILNKSKFKALKVPLPPLEEQRRIVAEVEERLGAIDALRAAIERAQRRGAALRRSVLERAFRGELVPQDPSDEPASVLLDRIRTEREASST